MTDIHEKLRQLNVAYEPIKHRQEEALREARKLSGAAYEAGLSVDEVAQFCGVDAFDVRSWTLQYAHDHVTAAEQRLVQAEDEKRQYGVMCVKAFGYPTAAELFGVDRATIWTWKNTISTTDVGDLTPTKAAAKVAALDKKIALAKTERDGARGVLSALINAYRAEGMQRGQISEVLGLYPTQVTTLRGYEPIVRSKTGSTEDVKARLRQLGGRLAQVQREIDAHTDTIREVSDVAYAAGVSAEDFAAETGVDVSLARKWALLYAKGLEEEARAGIDEAERSRREYGGRCAFHIESEEVAAMFGVDRTTVWKWRTATEAGERDQKPITREQAERHLVVIEDDIEDAKQQHQQAMDNLASLIRRYRRAGVTQKQVAEMLGVSRFTVLHYLGEREWNPSRPEKTA